MGHGGFVVGDHHHAGPVETRQPEKTLSGIVAQNHPSVPRSSFGRSAGAEGENAIGKSGPVEHAGEPLGPTSVAGDDHMIVKIVEAFDLGRFRIFDRHGACLGTVALAENVAELCQPRRGGHQQHGAGDERLGADLAEVEG